jgi:aminopeptidase
MTPLHTKQLEEYAKLVVAKGAAIYPEQKLLITTGYKNYDFACLLAEKAYERGASYVAIDVVSNKLTKTRISKSKDTYLSYVPSYTTMKYAEMCAEDWAFIRIDDTEELDMLQNLPAEKIGAIEKATRKAKHIFYKNLLGNKISWCVICAPGPEWAKHITGSEDIDGLMDILAPILRVDQEDPLAAWDRHGETLIQRRIKMNSLRIKTVHFESEGTDLTVELTKTSEWNGGPHATADGRIFSANIPSEEVFTTPHYSKTEGKVKVTRPLQVLESHVNGVEFMFKNGKVVDFTAEKGADILEEYFKADEGAAYLGEVALVGVDSPITQSKKLFGSILYDENASCHIALGSGYPSCLSNMNELHGDAMLKDAGCNVSIVHTDFMIGSEQTKVTAVDVTGAEHVIMENGLFVL